MLTKIEYDIQRKKRKTPAVDQEFFQ